jgi:hypothetical protein
VIAVANSADHHNQSIGQESAHLSIELERGVPRHARSTYVIVFCAVQIVFTISIRKALQPLRIRPTFV